MKKSLTIFFILTCFCITAQTYVPDDNFEQALIDLGYDSAPLDDYVPTANINSITTLDVGFKNISNLTGIEDFVALEVFGCYFNNLTDLNLSANTALKVLSCSYNNLTSLNLSDNAALTQLTCNNNNLTSLDVNSNLQLTALLCYDNNIISLDLSTNVLLNDLRCSNNNLELLNVKNGNNTSFSVFNAEGNSNLTCINVDNKTYSNTNWTEKDATARYSEYCYDSTYVPDDIFEQTLINLGYDSGALDDYVPTINIKNVTALDLNSKGISDLTGIEDFIALKELNCSNNILTALDLSKNTLLSDLECSLNQIESLDVSNNKRLKLFSCRNNMISSLNLRSNTSLVALGCRNNNLTVLNVKNGNNTNFIFFEATNNPDLTCIEVDDETYSNLNWPDKDTTANYNETCYSYIPDDNFEQALIDLGYDSGSPNDYVLFDNIKNIKVLNLKNKNIENLTGIEDFIALEELDCGNNNLTDLNISSNMALTHLSCFNNNLTSLNVSLNLLVKEIYCYDNNLNSINIITNTVLTNLDCNNNNLTNLDINSNPALTNIRCQNNNLSSLDINRNQNLTHLECHNNNLELLNAKNGNNNNFIDFNATGNPNLTCIQVDDAGYSTTNWINKDATASYNEKCYTYIPDDDFEEALVDLGHDSLPLNDYVPIENINSITSLNINTKSIEDLTGIEDFIALTELDCSSNYLTVLNVSFNSNLEVLNCELNELTNLNLSLNTKLTDLNCSYNTLESLDISNNIALKSLDYASNFNIENPLNLSNLINLEYLDCQHMGLENIDVTNNIKLITLFCRFNNLSSLDISQNLDLEVLSCGINNLTNIDVSKNTKLVAFSTLNNQLAEIDLSKNLTLETIVIAGENITALDLTKNQALTQIFVGGNDTLEILNLKNDTNTIITDFFAENNPNLTCIQVDDASYSNTNWTNIDATASFSENCGYTLSNEVFQESNFSIYPNPVSDFLNITSDFDIESICILDIQGKELLKSISTKLDVSQLKTGIYFIRINSSNNNTIKKIIKL